VTAAGPLSFLSCMGCRGSPVLMLVGMDGLFVFQFCGLKAYRQCWLTQLPILCGMAGLQPGWSGADAGGNAWVVYVSYLWSQALPPMLPHSASFPARWECLGCLCFLAVVSSLAANAATLSLLSCTVGMLGLFMF